MTREQTQSLIEELKIAQTTLRGISKNLREKTATKRGRQITIDQLQWADVRCQVVVNRLNQLIGA